MAKSLREQAKKEIASAMREALRTLASEAADAKHVVVNDAEISARALEKRNATSASDHDFLIAFASEVKTKLDAINENIKEIKDGTSHRIECLENEKLNVRDSYPSLYKKDVDCAIGELKATTAKHDTWITRIVSYGTVLVFLIGVAEAIIFRYYSNNF